MTTLDLVRNGEITTLADFAMLCAKSIDYLHEVEFKPDLPYVIQPRIDWFDQKIAEAEAELSTLRAMTLTEAKRAALADFSNKIDRRREAISCSKKWRRNAAAMLRKVNRWKPPTKQHRALKDHMIKELKTWATPIDYDVFHPMPPKPGPGWYADKIAKVEADLEQMRQDRAAEVKRAEEATAWLKELRASLA